MLRQTSESHVFVFSSLRKQHLIIQLIMFLFRCNVYIYIGSLTSNMSSLSHAEAETTSLVRSSTPRARRPSKRAFRSTHPTTSSEPVHSAQGLPKKQKHDNDNEKNARREEVRRSPFIGTGWVRRSSRRRAVTVSAAKTRPSIKPARDRLVKLHTCVECEYTSPTKSALTLHMRTHTREKHVCEECESAFTTKAHLTAHMRTHNRVKPYACAECEYTCATKAYLTIHMRTHTGEKPYVCGECEYTSAIKGNLTVHMRIHTGVKPYACAECEYTCSQKVSLTVHMRSHTGEKPYVCDQCEYTSARNDHLTKHMRTHTGVKPYACTECEYTCTKKIYLTKHMQTHIM